MLAENQAYLISIGVPADKTQNCLDAMAKYGDNKWWLSDDPKERAYYQMQEKLLLMSFSQFHTDIETLCNRPVFTHEFASEELKKEAARAWRYGVGCTSDLERKVRLQESVQELRDRGIDVAFVQPENNLV